MPTHDLVTLILIAAITLTSIIGWRNNFTWQRHIFHIGAILHNKQYHRLISHAFLHANGTHLAFNLITLYFFARPVAHFFGWVGLLLIFFAAVLGGALLSLFLYRHRPSYTAIGASGGVAGVLFAAIAVAPKLSLYLFFIPIPIEGWLFGTCYFAYSAYRMVHPAAHDNLAHAAHLGGAAAGMILALLLAVPYVIPNLAYLGIMILPWFYVIHAVWLQNKRL